MGCVSSKIFKRELNRDIVVVHNDLNHIVSLTSSTYGLLNLDNNDPPPISVSETTLKQRSSHPQNRRDPEVINTWELMEDLEEGVPISGNTKRSPKARVFLRGYGDIDVLRSMKLLNQIASPKKLKRLGGKENAGNGQFSPGATNYSPKDSVLKPRNSAVLNLTLPLKSSPVGSKRQSFSSSAKRSFSPLFDPDLIASVEREFLGEEQIKKMVSVSVSPSPRTRKQRKSREYSDSILNSFDYKCPPGGENAVVIYTTTLRGIRKTFEDCNNVRSIVESHEVLVFERDVSMDSGFKEELRKLMGTKEVRVPVVFVKGRLVGGAEEVVKLEEEGKLAAVLEGIPRAVGGCIGCAGVRFMMCGLCNGSCKVLDEEMKKMVRCSECNENGLIHCPICCS